MREYSNYNQNYTRHVCSTVNVYTVVYRPWMLRAMATGVTLLSDFFFPISLHSLGRPAAVLLCSPGSALLLICVLQSTTTPPVFVSRVKKEGDVYSYRTVCGDGITM